jgi:DUF1365 family protein
VGKVRHRRYSPVLHQFTYSLFWFGVDLDQIEKLFRLPGLFWTRRFSLVRFRREDYLGDPAEPLADCVRELVSETTSIEVTGPILLLTQVRICGLVFNPVSFYYCYDPTGSKLQAVVAEVTNTPWGERHNYVIPWDSRTRVQKFEAPKEFHVSPFMPMQMTYRWRLSAPTEVLTTSIENHDETDRVFSAMVNLQRREWTAVNILWNLIRFPLMSLQFIAAIYWQALRLWWKKVPYVPHPRTTDSRKPIQ